MATRGTRPTQPQRWGREAERIRTQLGESGGEIVRLAREMRTTTNIYLQRQLLAEIELEGERIQRLALQARIGVDPDAAS